MEDIIHVDTSVIIPPEVKKKYKTIGILGGIGPSASANMYSRIIKHMQNKYKAWDDADFPKIMVYSTALSGFDEGGIADAEAVKADLLKAVKRLEEMGSELIVVACNTVHHFDDDMEHALSVPLVNMIDEACEDVKGRGYRKVGIACSQSTRDLGLYSEGLKKLGVESVVATNDEQALINKAIKDVMAGEQGSNNIFDLNQVFARYQTAGAEAVVLGCTELPLAITQNDSTLEILDANDIVVKQAVELSIQ